MLLKAWNKALIEDREKTSLTVAAAAGDLTLTVAGVDSNSWASNDYIIVGEIGSPTTEVMQLNGTVTDGTSITIDRSGAIDGLRFAHSVGEPIYRIDFNQVEFSRNTTDTTSGVTVLTTVEIQPDDQFTRYEDTTNTTGYGFVRFYNATTTGFSSYSDGVNYEASGASSSYDPKTLWRLRKRVRILLDEDRPNSKLSDDMIRDAINDKQRDIAHQRLWSFYEYERSFSAVANQFAYDIPSTVQKIYNATFRTQPLFPINYDAWKMFNWNTNSSVAVPSYMCIWNRQLLVHQRPSTAAATTTLGAAISSTTATTITVAATSGFKRGDYYRFIIDSEVIYATTAASSTSFTGCLRGQEGTTAATHSNGATVTERDIVFTAHVEPADLMDTQDRTAIPESDIIAYGAAIDLAPLVEKKDMIGFFEQKYTTKLKELESKYALKQTAHFGHVKSADEKVQDSLSARNSAWRYTDSITGT